MASAAAGVGTREIRARARVPGRLGSRARRPRAVDAEGHAALQE